MEAIGSKYLNKNNILTTRYFNNNTFYLDTIKTTDGIKTKIYFNSNRIDAGNSSTIDKLSDRDKYYSNGYMIFTTREYVSTVGVYILNYTDGTLTYKNAVDIVQSSPNQSFIYYIDSKTPFDVWNDEEIKKEMN
ncbi:hypothetical protein CL6EHI_018150 [Entamoeba histolytica]|uniref:Uncharacterized protein n=1 Tax=Entamoeba histolytica TaxID=5759 RepID=A0A175K0J0_ENTHI|nr:hypothetical protein CL6EHI_018150 [Entamoeba histolytica]